MKDSTAGKPEKPRYFKPYTRESLNSFTAHPPEPEKVEEYAGQEPEPLKMVVRKGRYYMAGKKRTDNKGRILRTGERQRPEDNRYLYRYFDSTGKKRVIYALTLSDLRESTRCNYISVWNNSLDKIRPTLGILPLRRSYFFHKRYRKGTKYRIQENPIS